MAARQVELRSLLAFLLLAACPGDKDDDGGGGSTAGGSTGGSSMSGSGSSMSGSGTSMSGSSTSTSDASSTADTTAPGTTGSMCPEGTCMLMGGTMCEAPGGPLGNGCCACGDDGFCSSYCRCADPSTPIATPEGERPIADLEVGDLVYSVAGDAVIVAPIAAVHRAPIENHSVIEVVLEDGRELRMSAGHPTADGRAFGELRADDRLDGARVVAARRVPLTAPATHDILPASPTGIYFAAGVAVGSTLHRGAPAEPRWSRATATAPRCPGE